MKNIVVASDFSKVARNAFRYARDIGATFGSHLQVFHFHQPPMEPSLTLLPNWWVEREAELKADLEKFVKPTGKQKTAPPVPVKTEVVMGFLFEELMKITGKGQTDLVVLGTHRDYLSVEKWLGTTPADAVRHSHCPVLLVPEKAKFKGFKNILYACDFASLEEKVLEEVIGFAEREDAMIHFIHVGINMDTDAAVQHEVFRLMRRYEAVSVPYCVGGILRESVAEGLNTYAHLNKIDLIVMTTRHRNMLQNLVHTSATKEMATATEKPLLVLHG